MSKLKLPVDYRCNMHGEGVLVIFPKAFGRGGCPVCELQKTKDELQDYWEEDNCECDHD